MPEENNETRKTIWERWGRSQDWQDALHRKAAHKALDIPQDDMNITSSTRTGITAAGAVGIAAAAGLPSALVAAALLGGFSPGAKDSPPSGRGTAAAVAPSDSEYEVLFYDKDGNPISVPHISEKKD